MRALAAVLTATALALLAGCGDDDVTTTSPEEPAASTTATPTGTPSDPQPTPAPLPTCASVWPERTTLPESYAGCREGGERVVRSIRCETGQQLFTYAGRYFAVPGGPIFAAEGALADDPQFLKMERVCTA